VAGFVVCASCGTQIKAGREYCLRCGEAMPAVDEPAKVSIWESLQLSQGMLLTLLVLVSSAVVALLLFLWQTQLPGEEQAQPISVQSAPRPAAPPQEPAVPAEVDAPAPATAAPAPAPRDPSAATGNTLELHRTGSAAFSAGDFAGARKAYEQAIARNPEDADAQNNLGQTLVRLDKVSDAIAKFERAVVLAPTKSAFHFNLAQARGSLGQWDRAIPEYREAARLAPDDHTVRFSLATALQKKGDVAAAIPEYQRAIALNPGEPGFHLSLGQSLEQVGRTSEATREYETYIRLAPTAPDVDKLKEHVKAISAGRTSGAPPS
jgi:Flp pilus assembly protein TadD